MRKKENLHAYLTKKEKLTVNKFIRYIQTQGKMKLRKGDALTAILLSATKSPEVIRRVKKYIGGE